MKPSLDIDKGLSTSDVVNHNDAVGPPIIPVGPRCAVRALAGTRLLPWDLLLLQDGGWGRYKGPGQSKPRTQP